mmetsp:Transcript_37543/g.42906  ORF Transcript_37543/g.42906 Transcript_37543/m.42906 type:complete len:225 (-) Transcript_37543:437-1111(-)
MRNSNNGRRKQPTSTISTNNRIHFVLNDDFVNIKFCQEIVETKPSLSSIFLWRQRILKLSNWASILCVIDCTILPIVTLVLSVLGIISGNSNNSHNEIVDWLHDLGHSVALYFVLPVGSMTTTFNYYLHHSVLPTLTSFFGLFLIALSNMSHVDDNNNHSSNIAKGEWSLIHAFHEGSLHQLCNILGCCMQLWANYQSQKLHLCQDKNCKLNNQAMHRDVRTII